MPKIAFTPLKLKHLTPARDVSGRVSQVDYWDESWTLHDLRRTFSTGLIELGVSESVVDLLTNHISGEAHRGVRRHYNHARRDREKRDAVLLWEAPTRT